VNASYEAICIEFEQKTTTLDLLLSNSSQILKVC